MEITPSGRKSPKRLLIDIPDQLHEEIKKRAATRNITMRKWVIRAVMRVIEEEKKYDI